MKCVACGRVPVDRCHIKSRGAGGSDEDDNLISLCREHHSFQHKIGFKALCELFPKVEEELNSKGWEFQWIQSVWKLRREEPAEEQISLFCEHSGVELDDDSN